MSLYANLRQMASPVPTPAVSGQWFNIRFIPDLSTGERLNLGVGLLGEDGRIHAKLLTDFTRLHCLYGERIDSDELRFLLDLLRHGWSHPEEALRSPSPHLLFSPLKYAAGDSLEAILEDLYQVTVTLEPSPQTDRKATRDTHMIDTKTARERVFEAMVRKAPLSASLLAPNPIWPVNGGKLLDMPIRAPSQFATLISVWHTRSERREITALRAQADLDAARTLFPDDTGGLFILRPPPGEPGYDEAQQRKIDQVIEMTTWRLGVQGMPCEAEHDPEALAERVLSWSEQAGARA
ncbi:hypothetical protein [Thiorhodococcus minor]|uniref:DUF3037 domain-containing protein n=1 Tax=Thiorhodococcus minor TaxID=57489 RepID=A0A6M0K5Y6_9GAMM|nr:hypothetical protein [Thiorhodococcus minor]NEV64721.1 hypothetical protein [Thiorhodococcus minor]